MTGWAQVHDLRGDTSIDERAAYDNYYIENWSLGLDLKILLRTVGVVLIPPLRRRPAPSSPPVSSDEARAAS
jgi:lipopolysaccharide/colanic/teichoic acid biosynthesis glycosyltransferase